jgi:thiol-disulfide isomerase/thioredoxin
MTLKQLWLLALIVAPIVCGFGLVSPAIGEDEAVQETEQADAEDNPYIPRDDLSTLELFELVERMKNLPKALQGRPGFAEAIVVCADRILARQPDETMRAYATRARLDGFQRGAIWDESEAKRTECQKQLVDCATKCQGDPDSEVTKWAAFYLLENKVLEADKLEAEKLAPVLEEAQQFAKQNKLDNRHVRFASSLVRLINKLPSDEDADKAYKQFGELFAASTDDELHRYGDRISEGVGKRPVDLTGKQIAIAGPLFEGGDFDVEKWKGNVVLVDFWATWCGPCVASLPELQAIHERLHAKGFEIIGVNLDEDREALEAFLEGTPLPWPNIIDAEAPAESQMAKKYGISAIPTTFLLDKTGKLVATNLHGEALAAKIEELLGK